MKTLLSKVYQCEHCNRKMLGAGAMTRHEKYCRQNPNNQHKCFNFCKHLKRIIKEGHSEYDHEAYGYIPRKTEMVCTLLNLKMYSYKLEKKGYLIAENLVRMPLECDNHEYMEGYKPACVNK